MINSMYRRFVSACPHRLVLAGSALILVLALGQEAVPAEETAASAPVRTTLSVYDRGFALVNELRRVTLTKGESIVRLTQLPAGHRSAVLLRAASGTNRWYRALRE